jgi:ribosomal protein S8
MLFAPTVTNTLSAIHNGFISKQRQITIPVCKHTVKILRKLQDVGCIKTLNTKSTRKSWNANVVLRYNKGVPAYSKITVISKPSNRCTLT